MLLLLYCRKLSCRSFFSFFFFFYVTIWNLIKGTVLWTLSLSLHFFFFPFPKYFVFRRKFYSLQDRIPRKVLSRSNFDSLRIRFTDRVKVEKSRAYSSDTQHNRVTAVLTLIDARLARWGGRRGEKGGKIKFSKRKKSEFWWTASGNNTHQEKYCKWLHECCNARCIF